MSRAVYPRTFRVSLYPWNSEVYVTACVNGSVFMGIGSTIWAAFFGCLEQWQRWATQTGRISQ